ncbi:hypothetical protein EV177_005958 [Coemansia sp. RSA 1804]|nr:hypothetical protein EV177_005958 [Coemansia sp. RSA 1804]
MGEHRFIAEASAASGGIGSPTIASASASALALAHAGALPVSSHSSSSPAALHRTPSQSSFASGTRTPQTHAHTQSQMHAQALNDSGVVLGVQTVGGSDTAAGASVLALAHTDEFVFSGTQQGDIHVWRRETFQLERTLSGHSGGCQALAVDAAGGVLYSGGGDSTVRAWDTRTLECQYVVHAGVNAGAILSLAHWAAHRLLVLGCQDTSIQLFDIANRRAVSRQAQADEMAARRSRFFAEAAPAEGKEGYYVILHTAAMFAHTGYVHALAIGATPDDGAALFSAASDGIVGVWGLRRSEDGDADAPPTLERTASLDTSGSGDSEGDACVHSLALDGDGLLFAGLQSGGVDVWDLETWQRIRTLTGGFSSISSSSPSPSSSSKYNVLALAVDSRTLYAGAADGAIRMWRTADLSALGWIRAAENSVLALDALAPDALASGSSGRPGGVQFWDVAGAVGDAESNPRLSTNLNAALPRGGRHLDNKRLISELARWVRMRSVSGVAELQPECRRAARFLKDLMRDVGAADARLISSTPTANPIVYARFDASSDADAHPLRDTPTVFVYGHYDVMPAGADAPWRSPPFELAGRDGYVYGRGVSDDKGPVLATLFAVAELSAARRLPVTVVFCIEGEEESGSAGLRETLASHRALFGAPRVVLLSSAYWLGEVTPCLTYGMRGSIRATLRVESSRSADVHAGVWGGAVRDPLACLAHVVSQLVDPAGRVLVPGFSDGVRPADPAEDAAMRSLVRTIAAREATAPLVARVSAAAADAPAADAHDHLFRQLVQRWRQPSLTVHHVDVSTPAPETNATLVPAAAQAAISVRVVPDQSLDDIAAKLRAHVTSVFDEYVAASGSDPAAPALLDSLRLHLDVRPNAMWWLADPKTPVYQAAARAIREEWASVGARSGAATGAGAGSASASASPSALSDSDSAFGGDSADAHGVPLLIREGGSIPAVPWLESFFAPHAVAVNIPMGQSSDNAHLDNERISLENLMRGRQVIFRLLKDIASVIE